MSAAPVTLRDRIERKMPDAENDGHLTLCRLVRRLMDETAEATELLQLWRSATGFKMTDSSVEAVESIKAALYSNLRIEPVPNRMYDWRIEAESIDEAAEATLAAIAALPSHEREPMRQALVRAYKQGATDVHYHWLNNVADNQVVEHEADFTEAAYDYADAALAPPTAQSGDRA